MITAPVICRLRKLGCAVTAKLKMAPIAINVRQLAVLIGHSSDGDSGSAAARVTVRLARVTARRTRR
jgi:hypothetical protein